MTLADYALELASKATSGPWTNDFNIGLVECVEQPNCCEENQCKRIADINSIGLCRRPDQDEDDAAFIAASRTLIPELATRLKRACEFIRKAPWKGFHDFDLVSSQLADELEAFPEDEK